MKSNSEREGQLSLENRPTFILANPFRNLPPLAFLDFCSVHPVILQSHQWKSFKQKFWVIDVAQLGGFTVRVGGQDHQRSPGSVALYRPNTLYSEWSERGGTTEQAWIMFHTTTRNSPISKMLNKQKACFFEDPAGVVKDNIKAIFEQCCNERSGSSFRVQSCFFKIIDLLIVASQSQGFLIAPRTAEHKEPDDSLRARVEAVIASRLMHPLSMAEIASRLGMSLSTLSHRYPIEAGETIIQTRTRIRIEEAKRRLLVGECQIKVLAHELGFFDSAHFTRAFHTAVGVPPMEFRREFEGRFREPTPADTLNSLTERKRRPRVSAKSFLSKDAPGPSAR